MNKKSLTLTVIAKMTANYGEGLGNVSSIQRVFRNNQAYAIRSKESLKNAVMVQSGMYDDLEVSIDGAAQKLVSEDINAANNRSLEGGYMNTKAGKDKSTYKRNSSIYFTDAISTESFVNETRFHNDLYLAERYANLNGLNVQKDADKVGLMPFQYEFDKGLKSYSVTIDLEEIGKDDNFAEEASNEEKIERVNAILDAIQHLSLIVKGNLDNAEPLFVVGGISERKTHVFENVVKVKNNKLIISEELQNRLNDGFSCGLMLGDIFDNEKEIVEKLSPESVNKFFEKLKDNVRDFYN